MQESKICDTRGGCHRFYSLAPLPVLDPIYLEILKNENKTQIYLIRLESVFEKKQPMVKSVIYLLFIYQTGYIM